MKIDTLHDGGYVRLVNWMGQDIDIVRAARVSYDGDTKCGEDPEADAKLIRYLMKNKHTSPFESCQLTFEIKCPMFVARQWHRHRTWSYNEVSARYTELDMGYYVPKAGHVGTQNRDNKQMRDIDAADPEDDLQKRKLIDTANLLAFNAYRKLMEMGTPRELARSVLPAATYTRFYGSVNLHNLFHFVRLRIHEHSQYEIRVYAEAILEICQKRYPVATKAFMETL